MSDIESFFADVIEPDDPLRTDLINMIRARDDATPRHRQRELGPSEVAHPCMRRMAYGLMEVQRCNPPYDPLPSIIGTALHKWLESAAAHANQTLGRQRWLIETRVNVTSGLAGSCDLYDMDTATVIDHKLIGNSNFDKYRKHMSEVYRRQVHLYGKGFQNAGLPVKRVAINMLPRGRTLHSMHLWQEDYDEDLANEIVRQRNTVIALLDDFKVEANPQHYEWFSKSGPGCVWCPWFKPDPRTPFQCGGVDP